MSFFRLIDFEANVYEQKCKGGKTALRVIRFLWKPYARLSTHFSSATEFFQSAHARPTFTSPTLEGIYRKPSLSRLSLATRVRHTKYSATYVDTSELIVFIHFSFLCFPFFLCVYPFFFFLSILFIIFALVNQSIDQLIYRTLRQTSHHCFDTQRERERW